MRVLEVAQQVHVAPGVVEADDRRADEGRAAEREEVVRGVVEQHRDVARAFRRQSLGEQRREAHRLLEVLAVRPRVVAEPDRDPVAELLRVAPQERGRVRSDEGCQTGRRDRGTRGGN